VEASQGRRKDEGGKEQTIFLCNQWQWWVIFSNTTNSGLVEHPLWRSTILVNLALRYIVLVDLDLVDLDCLANFLWSGAIFAESRVAGAVPN